MKFTAMLIGISIFSLFRCAPRTSPEGARESAADREAGYARYPEALYPVRVDGGWGYINRRAEMVLPPVWESAEDFAEDLAIVRRDGRFGAIDRSGKVIIPPVYERMAPFREGLSAVQREGQYGFIDLTGREVIPCQYEAAGAFREGYAGVKINGWTAIIDKTGRVLTTPPLTIAVSAIEYVDGRTRAFGADELTGFLDTTGAWAIEPRFHSAGRFSEGLAWAMVREEDASAEHGFQIRGGFIDTSGQFVIPPAYDFGWDVTEGHAVVWRRSADKQHKVWSVLDRSGRAVLDGLHYRNMGALHQGLIAIQDDDMHWGFLDLSGHVVIPPTYTGINLFRDGLARMEKGDAFDTEIVYINPKGEVVWSE